MLYMLLGGHQPFEDENVPRLISRITLGEYDLTDSPWNKISDSAKDLIKRMLEISPTIRLSLREVIQHPWMNERQTVEEQLDLFEVKEDFLVRKSRKDQGKISLAQVMCVGNIHYEILKKGLEIANLFYTKSSTTMGNNDGDLKIKSKLAG